MKAIFNITCGVCQAHLIAYVQGDVTPLMRRRIARHLDHCVSCYAQYRSELNIVQTLSRDVPLIGQASQPNFDNLWSTIQSGIQTPKISLPHFHMRYGLAMLAMLLVFLMPLTLGNHSLALETPPTQPAPLIVRMTPDSTAPITTSTTVAFLTDESQATPEASHHNAGPSVQDVVNTP